MPIAESTESDPVGMNSIGWISRAPIRMIEPLPNCRSIWVRAPSIAFIRSAFGSAMSCSRVRFSVRLTPLYYPQGADPGRVSRLPTNG